MRRDEHLSFFFSCICIDTNKKKNAKCVRVNANKRKIRRHGRYVEYKEGKSGAELITFRRFPFSFLLFLRSEEKGDGARGTK
jgi:hypothetical protein